MVLVRFRLRFFCKDTCIHKNVYWDWFLPHVLWRNKYFHCTNCSCKNQHNVALWPHSRGLRMQFLGFVSWSSEELMIAMKVHASCRNQHMMFTCFGKKYYLMDNYCNCNGCKGKESDKTSHINRPQSLEHFYMSKFGHGIWRINIDIKLFF